MKTINENVMLVVLLIGLAVDAAQAKTLAETCGSRVDSGGAWGTWNLVSEKPLFIIQEGSTRQTSEREIEDNFWANLEYSIQKEDAQQKQAASKLKKWLQCLTNKGKTGSDALQTTSKIPNCPPLLPASCVSWSLYDRQLNWWNVNNFCEKDAKVAFRGDSGTHEETQVFGPGEKTRVTWRGSREPTYVVWDAQASITFYREKAPGAVLQCRKSMPF